MRLQTSRSVLVAALVASAVAWSVGFMINPSGAQRKVTVAETFVDYEQAVPWVGCRDAYSGGDRDGVRAIDRAYPPVCYDILRPFPSDVRIGGMAFAVFSGVIFVLAFSVLMKSKGASVPCTVALAFAAGLSSPHLAAAANANVIVLAAAGVALWAAWRNAESPWLRGAAVAALAFAAAMKIVPAVFALCYLRERRFKEFAAFALVAAAIFFVPFAWYGGMNGFCDWFANARGNALFYRSKGAWGLVPIDRTIRVMGGMPGRDTFDWPTLGVSRAVNVVAGLACLVAAWRAWRAGKTPCHDNEGSMLLLLCGAMLLIPGNMHFYTGIYLLVPFAAWLFNMQDLQPENSPSRKLENLATAFCWFFVFSPLQIPFGQGCLNHPLANIAFMALALLAILKGGRGRGR